MKRRNHAWVLAVLSALAGCSQVSSPATSAPKTSAGITATLSATPSPPHTGDDVLTITLVDAKTSQPIGDANLTASAQAQSPHLPGQAVTGRSQGNGIYQVPVVLAVPSPYLVQVSAQRPGQPTATFLFKLDVSH